MKKHIVIAAGLAVLSTSAFATKARMDALGQNATQGSYFIQDSRNVFRNASAVNDMSNYVVTEWGSSPSTATAPNAEGGFFRTAGNFAYGLYLGSDVSAHTHTNDLAGALNESNRLTAFLGGDMGVKWGASFFYSSNKTEPTAAAQKQEHGAMGIGLGAQHGAFDAHFNMKLKDEAKGNGTVAAAKSEADLMQIGAGYTWGSYKFYAEYTKGSDEANNGTAKTNDNEDTTLIVGVGHTQQVSASSRVFTNLQYENSNDKQKLPAPADKDKKSKLPLTIGFETDATSWLALRGSIKQVVLVNSEKNNAGKKTQKNTTDVAAGATLNFGKLKVDGMIGTTASSRAAAAQAEEGVLALDNLMTKVAVHYWF